MVFSYITVNCECYQYLCYVQVFLITFLTKENNQRKGKHNHVTNVMLVSGFYQHMRHRRRIYLFLRPGGRRLEGDSRGYWVV